MKILIVEDKASLRAGLHDLVEGAGHEAESVGDGLAGLRRGQEPVFDLLLLDLMLPGRDGIEVCRKLREVRPELLILILTARGSEDDKVQGLSAGADDYLTKPFGAKELLARIDALARRRGGAAEQDRNMELAGWRFDLSRLRASRDGEDVSLTVREAGILRLLHHHRDRAVTRAELLEEVWHARGDMMTRTVDMAVAKLRRKLEADPASPSVIVTVKGIGYAWGKN